MSDADTIRALAFKHVHGYDRDVLLAALDALEVGQQQQDALLAEYREMVDRLLAEKQNAETMLRQQTEEGGKVLGELMEAVTDLRQAEQRAETLAAVLSRILEWPLPKGSVEEWALPLWLARNARAALASDSSPGTPHE